MKTLYEVLEVSENASDEVIEKAYRVLAKKYHPDLQKEEDRQHAEEKMKQINEAYDILGNEQKRKEYDHELAEKRQIEKQQKSTYQAQQYQENYQGMQNEEQTKEYNQVSDMQRRRQEEHLRRQEEQARKQMQANLQKEYENAYYRYLKALGFRIKEKWTWKKTKTLILTILMIVTVIAVLWLFPPTHNMMMSLYENNVVIKICADVVIGIGTALVEAFMNTFQSLWKR